MAGRIKPVSPPCSRPMRKLNVPRAASVQEILEAFADRAAIEQDFHDVEEVWGSDQPLVRNIWTNLAVYNLNLWMHTLVELWDWSKSRDELADRGDSPWDDPLRRRLARQPPKSPAPTHSPQRIIEHHRRLAVTTKNHPTGRTPRGLGRLTRITSPKVQLHSFWYRNLMLVTTCCVDSTMEWGFWDDLLKFRWDSFIEPASNCSVWEQKSLPQTRRLL